MYNVKRFLFSYCLLFLFSSFTVGRQAAGFTLGGSLWGRKSHIPEMLSPQAGRPPPMSREAHGIPYWGYRLTNVRVKYINANMEFTFAK